MKVGRGGEGRGGGELTSDSKWGAGNTSSQQLLIIFKKVGVAEATTTLVCTVMLHHYCHHRCHAAIQASTVTAQLSTQLSQYRPMSH